MKRIVGGIMFVVGIMGVILAGLGFLFWSGCYRPDRQWAEQRSGFGAG